MTQDRQIKKVKKYRVLKVVFYCLGLPLFLFAVFLSAFKFIGNDPFTGTSEFTSELGFFHDIEVLFTSPALYGVWIAFAIWLVLAIIHIILSKTVKSRRTRMFSMVALTLVVMMGTMFCMDAVLSAKVDEIAAGAPEGVTVSDYKTQLSYYRTITSSRNGAGMTDMLISQVELFEKAYNVEMEGINKSGAAGNIGNKPVTYKNIIADDGTTGVDISFTWDTQLGIPKIDCDPTKGNLIVGDGYITDAVEGAQEIRLAPNGNGKLVINGDEYSHYFYVERWSTKGEPLYTWYTKDLMPVGTTTDGGVKIPTVDGIYGKGVYNASGMLADGWIFSLDNALRILEDYYAGKAAIDSGSSVYYADYYSTMYKEAAQRRDDYYNGLIPDENGKYVDAWTTALYNQEVQMTERFSLTRGEIDELIAKVGALLGDNSLFDYIFINIDSVLDELDLGSISILGSTLGNLFKQLSAGMSLSSFGLTGATMNTVVDILKTLTKKDNMIIDDLYLTVAYKAKDSFGRVQDHLYVGLVRGVGNWSVGSGELLVTRNADGQWVYTGVDGRTFVPTVKNYDSREVVNNEGVWAYADGSGEVEVEGFEPVVKYFIDKEVEVTKDEDGNWIYADDASAVLGDEEPVARYFVEREVTLDEEVWKYVDGLTPVALENFVPTQKYFDAVGTEIMLNAAGDAFFYEDGTQVPVVKVTETVGEDEEATTVEKWVYDGVDGTEFVEMYDEDGKFVAIEQGAKKVDMFGNELTYTVSIGKDPAKDIILDIDFDDMLVDKVNGTYAFDFDTLSKFLNTGLNNLLDKYNISLSEGTISTILGLVKTLGILKEIKVNGESYTGLVIAGIEIPLINSKGKVDIDIIGILENLLSTMYSYQSPLFKPVWEFYVDNIYDDDGNLVEDEYYFAQCNYAKYERALYMGKIQGGISGSVLIGDNLGTGAYPASLGLGDLTSVQQLINDLSYQRTFFPLYALRDMLAFFTGLVILFYFASFVMAQKEEDYASGKVTVRAKKEKKASDESVIAEFDALELENAAENDAEEEDEFDDTLDEEEEPVKEKKSLFGWKKKVEEPLDEEDGIEEVDDADEADEVEEEPVKKKGLFGWKKKAADELELEEEATTDELEETVEEPVKEKKSLFGRKKKDVVEDDFDETDSTADELADVDVVEEEPVKKKGLFGWKKKDEVVEDEPAFELNEEASEPNLDDVEEEPVKEKKSLFGRKKKEVVEDDFDETDSTADELADVDVVEEEPVKKKGLFGRKKKEEVEELDLSEELATDSLDEEEAPVKEKKGLFGWKKKKNEDIDEDTALPVSENSDEEVL